MGRKSSPDCGCMGRIREEMFTTLRTFWDLVATMVCTTQVQAADGSCFPVFPEWAPLYVPHAEELESV